MELLVEVKVENDLPINNAWDVPHLSATQLLPVVYKMQNPDMTFEWTEENVFRASKNEEGKIGLEFPASTKNFDLLAFCIRRIIEGMVRAVVDTAWTIEVYKRLPKTKGGELWTPQTQVRGPLKL